jgi:hypothetical protein
MIQDQVVIDVFKEMEKLTPEHFIRTYYTVAELRWPAFDRTYKKYVILPVDVYERYDMGYEIMPVRILAANCPWDMNQTIVKIDSENTHIEDNLHEIVVADAELHKYLCALDGSKVESKPKKETFIEDPNVVYTIDRNPSVDIKLDNAYFNADLFNIVNSADTVTNRLDEIEKRVDKLENVNRWDHCSDLSE